ncbi:hypothetical protein GUJ93_ZPchr0012g19531 [Zizania palustris]|uniref:Uncharacterized protein n=1 Tax=Zizania palustris TaxID=103762 RepID=A0A8J5WRD9_ZIZPA|nr:hypothetical protein GUJ93_ZPchr0012g19531 [Zizania palustris]
MRQKQKRITDTGGVQTSLLLARAPRDRSPHPAPAPPRPSMAVGIALLLDLASRAPRSSSAVHSHAAISAAAAGAAAAAALSASGVPLSARHLFGFPGFTIAHCDAGATAGLNDIPDLINNLNDKIQAYFQNPIKEYPVELKPLFSAFGYKNFGLTTLRSFLLYYLPLLEPHPLTDGDDEDDLLQDESENKPVDLVTPFHNSVKQIIRETSVVTTRRILERIAVCHVSQRTAWKLLKDASKSSKRKAARGISFPEYTYCVARTTFRAHALGVAAAWVVQSIIEVYRCFIRKPCDDHELFDDNLKMFGKKIYGITIKCGFSLVFASIGAGLGVLVHPVHGQWLGCTLGDFTGPIVAILVFEKLQLPL